MHVQAYLYDGYWEDIGTIEAFYNANLALTKNPKPDYRYVSATSLPRRHCCCLEAWRKEESWPATMHWLAGHRRPLCRASHSGCLL